MRQEKKARKAMEGKGREGAREVWDGERQIRAIEGPRLPSVPRKEKWQGCLRTALSR